MSYQLLALALVGLCIGSFVTAVVDRAGAGFKGLLSGRSRCPSCRTALGAADLIPVLSWLVLRRRCRHCGAPISASYPLTELAAATIGAVAGSLVADLVAAVVLAAVGWWLLAAALIDLREMRLPDALTLPLCATGLLLAAAGWPAQLALPLPAGALLGAVTGFVALALVRFAYARIRNNEGLGLGDAKLAAAAGAWLGATALPWLVLIAALVALAGATLVHGRLRGDLAVPFGPALALAFWGLLLAAQLGG